MECSVALLSGTEQLFNMKILLVWDYRVMYTATELHIKLN